MAFFLVFDRADFGMKTIVRSAAPTIMGLWWYVTAYATFLALLPFLSRGGATRARRTHALHTCHNGADNMSVYVQCFFDKITAVFHSVGGSRFSHDWQRTGQALVSWYDSASWFPIAFLMNEKVYRLQDHAFLATKTKSQITKEFGRYLPSRLSMCQI